MNTDRVQTVSDISYIVRRICPLSTFLLQQLLLDATHFNRSIDKHNDDDENNARVFVCICCGCTFAGVVTPVIAFCLAIRFLEKVRAIFICVPAGCIGVAFVHRPTSISLAPKIYQTYIQHSKRTVHALRLSASANGIGDIQRQTERRTEPASHYKYKSSTALPRHLRKVCQLVSKR